MTDSTVALDATFTMGAQPTKISGAPALPNPTLVVANYPALDKVPPTDSPQGQQWLSQVSATIFQGGWVLMTLVSRSICQRSQTIT